MAPSNQKKKSSGRQKIEMKFIENDGARMSTFSKRKHGLFKKATEFTATCGAKLVVIFFSICGRAYSFGSPSVDAVLDKVYGSSSASAHEEDYFAPDAKFIQDQVKKLKCHSDNLTAEFEVSKSRTLDLNKKLFSTCPPIMDEVHISQVAVSKLGKLKQKLLTGRDQLRSKAVGGDLLALEKDGATICLANIEMDESEKSSWLKL